MMVVKILTYFQRQIDLEVPAGKFWMSWAEMTYILHL